MVDDIDKSINKGIAKHGYFVALFEEEDGEPAFAHTIGLFELSNHPELVIFGLDIETMTILLSDAADRVKAGATIVPDEDYDDFLEGYKLRFIHANLDEYKGFFNYALDHYDGHEFPILQVIWPDEQHRYPWDEKFNPALKDRQPLLI